jgi:hypothetical protein
MESNSEKNRVHMSEAAASLLRKQAPELPTISRGKLAIKGVSPARSKVGPTHICWRAGKGKVVTYFLAPRGADGSTLPGDTVRVTKFAPEPMILEQAEPSYSYRHNSVVVEMET